MILKTNSFSYTNCWPTTIMKSRCHSWPWSWLWFVSRKKSICWLKNNTESKITWSNIIKSENWSTYR